MTFAKKLLLTAMTLVVVTGMAACGKKASPKPPDGATYPHQYPKPQADKPQQP